MPPRRASTRDLSKVEGMSDADRDALAAQFKTEVHDKAAQIDDGIEVSWRDLTFGWAIAKLGDPGLAFRFALYIRYHTNLG